MCHKLTIGLFLTKQKPGQTQNDLRITSIRRAPKHGQCFPLRPQFSQKNTFIRLARNGAARLPHWLLNSCKLLGNLRCDLCVSPSGNVRNVRALCVYAWVVTNMHNPIRLSFYIVCCVRSMGFIAPPHHRRRNRPAVQQQKTPSKLPTEDYIANATPLTAHIHMDRCANTGYE